MDSDSLKGSASFSIYFLGGFPHGLFEGSIFRFCIILALYGNRFVKKNFSYWKEISLLIALAISLSFLF